MAGRAAGGTIARRLAVSILTTVVLLSDAMSSVGPSLSPARAQTRDRPNIVLIVTDDQRADSLAHMPALKRSLIARGMSFTQAVVSTPLCCPSRASILTGRLAHSTGVYENDGDFGGWPAFARSRLEWSTIATALDDAGYRTGLFGKYLNRYDLAGAFVPPGWDRWFAFANKNGGYFGYRIYDDRRGFRFFGDEPHDYSTDVLRRHAIRFVRETPSADPLFLMVTPFAPHEGWIPAPRHAGALADAPVSLNPAVSEADVSDKPAHIQALPLRSPEVARQRTIRQWETLLAVDDLIRGIVRVLGDRARLDHTLLVFLSDNGLSNFEHRWADKRVPYEGSIRIPLVVRLDGVVPAGATSDALVSNVDLAPTIAELAGVSLDGTDGLSFGPVLTGAAASIRDEVLLEATAKDTGRIPAYCGVRTPSRLFVRHATGEEELYDLAADPWQLVNVVQETPRVADELRSRTKALCQPTPPGFGW
jgi:N-acetylglucosamine-6-sulfatase